MSDTDFSCFCESRDYSIIQDSHMYLQHINTNRNCCNILRHFVSSCPVSASDDELRGFIRIISCVKTFISVDVIYRIDSGHYNSAACADESVYAASLDEVRVYTQTSRSWQLVRRIPLPCRAQHQTTLVVNSRHIYVACFHSDVIYVVDRYTGSILAQHGGAYRQGGPYNLIGPRVHDADDSDHVMFSHQGRDRLQATWIDAARSQSSGHTSQETAGAGTASQERTVTHDTRVYDIVSQERTVTDQTQIDGTASQQRAVTPDTRIDLTRITSGLKAGKTVLLTYDVTEMIAPNGTYQFRTITEQIAQPRGAVIAGNKLYTVTADRKLQLFSL